MWHTCIIIANWWPAGFLHALRFRHDLSGLRARQICQAHRHAHSGGRMHLWHRLVLFRVRLYYWLDFRLKGLGIAILPLTSAQFYQPASFRLQIERLFFKEVFNTALRPLCVVKYKLYVLCTRITLVKFSLCTFSVPMKLSVCNLVISYKGLNSSRALFRYLYAESVLLRNNKLSHCAGMHSGSETAQIQLTCQAQMEANQPATLSSAPGSYLPLPPLHF